MLIVTTAAVKLLEIGIKREMAPERGIDAEANPVPLRSRLRPLRIAGC